MGKKTKKYNYVLLSEVNKFIVTKKCDLIKLIEVSYKDGDRKVTTELHDTDKLHHIIIGVHDSLTFDRMDRQTRKKLGITTFKDGDVRIYVIPIKAFKDFCNKETGVSLKASLPVNEFFSRRMYNGDINSFMNKDMLQLARFVYLCTKKKRVAEIIH